MSGGRCVDFDGRGFRATSAGPIRPYGSNMDWTTPTISREELRP